MELSRITSLFNTCHAQNRAALIAYITAGDPNLQTSLALMHALVKGGIDIIELGVPFSDPIADGPVIQASHQRAIQEGTTLEKVFLLASEFRKVDNQTPLVLMSYLNPIEQMGTNLFCKKANGIVDGVLVVDMPIEEGTGFNEILKNHQIDVIGLIAPTTSEMRLHKIMQGASGFLYYIALKGITGALHLQKEFVKQKLLEVKTRITLPLAVGFGIQNAATANALAQVADGVVVGTALLRIVEKHRLDGAKMLLAVSELVQKLRMAMDKNK